MCHNLNKVLGACLYKDLNIVSLTTCLQSMEEKEIIFL